MKHIYKTLSTFSVFLLLTVGANAQTIFFTDITAPSINPGEKRTAIPEQGRIVSLDTLSLLTFFKTLPVENNLQKNSGPIIEIPMPDGSTNQFYIWESSMMEPALAAKFPNLKTYNGRGIDDSMATIKIDWTSYGFHAMILSPVRGSVFIDPYTLGNKVNYISYFKSDVKKTGAFSEPEIKKINSSLNLGIAPQILSAPQCVGAQLQTYRLAVACTGEYAIAATGVSAPTLAETLSAILTTVNRVDGVYKTELSIHFVLVANEDRIVFTNPATDPFTGNGSPGVLINESQTVIDDSIGDANYDIGHTFSTGAGGVSAVGVVCQSSFKAHSVTGIADPVGDPFSIDYVAHEIGHEFGAHHPFNSDYDACGAPGQGYSLTNDEPGSGSTIMGYASGIGSGILCASDNLQESSDPYFNGINFDEIEQYAINGSGSTCPVLTATGNNAPIVNAGTDYTIPLSTPFVLTGSATDPDGDALTYCWEQVDVGGPFGPWNMPVGNAPCFRSFLPMSSTSRYFPQISDVINNTTTIGEIMPSYGRTMHFRLTARDNRSTGGGVCFAETTVTVDSTSGPFKVTYPDSTGIIWNAGDTETITWNPAGTASSPVNCSNVTILLSIDGGLIYSDTLLSSAPNTGTAQIQVPINNTAEGRIKIMSAGNIFYDISNNDFTIQKGQSPRLLIIYPNPDNAGTINISSILNNDHVEIELFDMTGKLMAKHFYATIPAGAVTAIPSAQFPSGVYILKFQSNNITNTQKIILQ
ncbi:MAG TPA: zinc-dependent metalloprotease family protein [Ferruginibacter sp.]|jgi:hypothetical protein|nr:zinc-dependent metalloprotease family protein [Ferruginibacter sp.]